MVLFIKYKFLFKHLENKGIFNIAISNIQQGRF